MYHAVKDCIGESFVSESLIPVFDRQLGGNYQRVFAAAVIGDFKKVAALFFRNWYKSEVIEYKQIEFCQFGKPSRVSAIEPSNCELLKESWCSCVRGSES